MILQQGFVQRANEAHLLLSSLQISKHYIDKVIASMADALIVTTSSGIIKTANQFAQDLFGYSQDELINQSISRIILDENFLNKINNLSNNYGEFLKDNDWEQEKKLKHYRCIENSVRRMTELLDDFLLISKADAGKIEFNLQLLDLNKFCSNLVEECQLSFGSHHQIILTYSASINLVSVDESLLLQILNNLLTNAIKYSPQETIVHFNCTCVSQEVIFEIQDQGIGIPVEDQSRLFESFHRAKNVGNIPGTGLGLAIVEKAVKLHGGAISFVSQVGVGTTFKISLPLNNQDD